MRWLVDGMNVVGSRPDGWWRDRPGAMAALAARLSAFAGDRGEEVTVVFDGRPRDLGPTPGLDVRFAPAPGRDAADAVIARLAGEDPDPAGLAVVTSDGALAERVRATGAQVHGAGAFRATLDDTKP
jgi:predicted RNA-binding protein with PIN domain